MNPIPLSSKNFQRIIQFYLFESPTRTFQRKKKSVIGATPDQPHPKYNFIFKNVSKRGKTFAERGLDGSNLNSLRAAMQRVTKVNLVAVDSEKELIDKADSMSPNEEYLIIKRNKDNVSVTEGYFYCIRNSFAHGDFDVERKIYILKNEDHDTIKGLARIKESSLLAWIELVNMDIDDIKKAGRSKKLNSVKEK